VTATRDRRSDLDDDEPGALPWRDRPIAGSFKGLPWWAAVLVALVLAAVVAFIDIQSSKNLGWVFKGGYFVGCALAVCLVQRRSLFGPMVQPPLVLAVTVPLVVLLTGGATGAGVTAKALAIGNPLINGFPVMAVTTAATIVLGVVRMFLQRDPDAPTKEERAEARRLARREDSRAARPERGDAAARRRPAEGRDRRADDRRGDRGDRPAEGRRPARDADPADRRGGAGRGDRPVPPSRSGGAGRPSGGRPNGGDRQPPRGRQEPPARGGRQSPPPRRPRPRDEDY
jgi:hypothetical protein